MRVWSGRLSIADIPLTMSQIPLSHLQDGDQIAAHTRRKDTAEGHEHNFIETEHWY
jgi:hypothetical protein